MKTHLALVASLCVHLVSLARSASTGGQSHVRLSAASTDLRHLLQPSQDGPSLSLGYGSSTLAQYGRASERSEDRAKRGSSAQVQRAISKDDHSWAQPWQASQREEIAELHDMSASDDIRGASDQIPLGVAATPVDDYFEKYFGSSGARRYRAAMTIFLEHGELTLEALTFAQQQTRALSKITPGTTRHARQAERIALYNRRIGDYLAANDLSMDAFRHKATIEKQLRVTEAVLQGRLLKQPPKRREYQHLYHLRRQAMKFLEDKFRQEGSLRDIDVATLRSLALTFQKTSHLDNIRGVGAQSQRKAREAFFRGETGLNPSVVKHVKFLRGRIDYGLRQGQDMSRMQVTLQKWQDKVDAWLAEHGEKASLGSAV